MDRRPQRVVLNVPTTSTLSPVFRTPISVNGKGCTVTFFIRTDYVLSNKMIDVMQNHKVSPSSMSSTP